MKRASRWAAGILLATMPALNLAAGPDQIPATMPVEARPQAHPRAFIRFVDEGPKGARLEVAQVTYQNPDGVTLRLVSAVHIGEKSYYDALKKDFIGDDAVLYEMVKARNAPPPRPGQHGDHAVTKLQTFLKDKLGLLFQLDAIDYRRPNFVHADLDAETFMNLQEQRGESMASLLLESMSQAMANPAAGQGGDGDLLVLMASPDPARQMRQLLARQMQGIESTLANLGGPNGSVILTERNKRAIEVLGQQLKLGKKRLSLFYGAAHMADLSDRVLAMGFVPVTTQWIMAWDVTIRKDQPSMLQRWFGSPTTRPTTAPSALN